MVALFVIDYMSKDLGSLQSKESKEFCSPVMQLSVIQTGELLKLIHQFFAFRVLKQFVQSLIQSNFHGSNCQS